MAGELDELIPALRDIMTTGEDASFLEDFKLKLNNASDFGNAFIKESLEDISKNVEFVEGRGFIVKNLDVIEELETVLKTGDVTNLLQMGGVDLENVEVQNAIRTFKQVSADLPERILTDLENDLRNEAIPLETEGETLDNITDNPNDVRNNQELLEQSPKTAAVSSWFDRLIKTIKVVSIAGIVIALGAYLAEYIKNYIRAKSGAFEVTTTDGNVVEKKISKYSCGYPGGDIAHPFDKEITEYLHAKDPCLDVAKYDNCAGWATIGKGSRLSDAKIDVSKLGRNRTLICRKATAIDAIADLAKKVEDKISDIVKNATDDILDIIAEALRPLAPFIGFGGGIFTGGVVYFGLSSQRTVIRLVAAFVMATVIGVLLYLIITHLRPKKTQSTGVMSLTPIYYHKIAEGMYVF